MWDGNSFLKIVSRVCDTWSCVKTDVLMLRIWENVWHSSTLRKSLVHVCLHFKMHFDLTSVNQLFFFFFFRALQYTYLYPVKTEQMSGCLMCWNIKRTLFVRARLCLFYSRCLRRGETRRKAQLASKVSFPLQLRVWKKKNPTVEIARDRTTLCHSCSRHRPA